MGRYIIAFLIVFSFAISPVMTCGATAKKITNIDKSCVRDKKTLKNLKCRNDLIKVRDGISDIIADVFRLNLNLLSWDTFKVISTVFPLYIGMRMVDDRIQNNFFCYTHKKNVNQLPSWCHEFVRFGLGVPIVLLGSQAFLSR